MPDANGPTDEELVRRVREGDEAAARQLFERHLPALRAKARARLPTALRGKVAESDVIQDAWLAAFLDLGGFDDRGDGSFGAWLRAILEHKIGDELRRRTRVKKRDARREVRLATAAAQLEPSPDQTSPSGEAIDSERAARLRAAVEALSADHAAVIRLVHQDGLTLAAAAGRLGRSANATRKLYARALVRLSEELPPDGSA